VDNTQIFTSSWPRDLDPATVPFTKRTATVLERQGIYTNPALLNELTTTDVLGWWNAGPATVEDLRVAGNDAIRRHHTETGLLAILATDLSNMASESWAPHVWYHDPRFTRFVPKGDLTVYEIATSGSAVDQRFLWQQGVELRDAVDAQARLPLLAAVAEYVEAVSGQHGERLDALLACTGLNGRDPITGAQVHSGLVCRINACPRSSGSCMGHGTVRVHRRGYGCHSWMPLTRPAKPSFAGTTHSVRKSGRLKQSQSATLTCAVMGGVQKSVMCA
jgi:hypothetical protein